MVSLDPYRRASHKILEIFKTYCGVVEKASIDESFLDLSDVVKSTLLQRFPELSLPPPSNDLSYNLPLPPTLTIPDDGSLGVFVPLPGEEEEDILDWDDVIMLLAAEIVTKVRKEVETTLGYTCSAGIARNKMLAKLSAGWKKPNQQVSLNQSV